MGRTEVHYYPPETPHEKVLPETSFKAVPLQEHLGKILPCVRLLRLFSWASFSAGMSPKHVSSPREVLWCWKDRQEHPGFELG